jgi:hypothetical protein
MLELISLLFGFDGGIILAHRLLLIQKERTLWLPGKPQQMDELQF